MWLTYHKVTTVAMVPIVHLMSTSNVHISEPDSEIPGIDRSILDKIINRLESLIHASPTFNIIMLLVPPDP